MKKNKKEYKIPTIFSIRKEKIDLEQAACWQCDLVTSLDQSNKKELNKVKFFSFKT